MSIETLKGTAQLAMKLVPSGIFPLGPMQKFAGSNLAVPFYHVVSDENLLHLKHLYLYRNVEEFTHDIDFFLRHFTAISLGELLDSITNGHPLPETAFLLTFDDGLRQVYDIVAPILRRKGVPAVFFLTSSFLDNKNLFYRHKVSILLESLRVLRDPGSLRRVHEVLMDNRVRTLTIKSGIRCLGYRQQHVIDDIAAALAVDFDEYLAAVRPYLDSTQVDDLLEQGFSIGAHSVDHPDYRKLSLDEQFYQTKQSAEQIRERFSLDYMAFSFPHRDTGISRRLFDRMYNGGIVDVSFGASGIVQDTYPNHLQRFWMEDQPVKAETIVGIHYAIHMCRRLFGRSRIVRNR